MLQNHHGGSHLRPPQGPAAATASAKAQRCGYESLVDIFLHLRNKAGDVFYFYSFLGALMKEVSSREQETALTSKTLELRRHRMCGRQGLVSRD